MFTTLFQTAEETKRKIPGRAEDTITLIHFNDVQNVESREDEDLGEAARFLSAVHENNDMNPLVLFSGNAFSPNRSM